MADDSINQWSAQQAWARWTAYLLASCLALNVAGVYSGFTHHVLLDRVVTEGGLAPQAVASVARDGGIATLQLVAFGVTGIVWLLWLHRAYRNLRLVGTKRSRFAPGWAVWSWFVPFLNLVRPYQIVKELWQRSESLNDRDSFTGLPAPTFLPWWWGTYVSSWLLHSLQGSLLQRAHSLDALTRVTDVAIVGDAAGVVAAVLAILVVRGINGRQQLFSRDGRAVWRSGADEDRSAA